jgi:4-hydroxy-3-methylbut-2-enyl diphosphate reductase IspH
VTAGASTPDSSVEAVVRRIQEIAEKGQAGA